MTNRTGDRHDDEDTRRPIWVNTFAAIALVLVIIVVALMLAGGHGPGRHD